MRGREASTRIPNVLSIAGSDPSGGAGVQADLKSILASGGYGMAALTALTAQSTRAVSGVHVPPPGFVRDQLDAVASDIRIDAVKTGMIGGAAVIAEVVGWLDALAERPAVVVDPVMIATSGDRLIDADAEHALHDLIARADVVTPNLPELAVLVGEDVAGDWPAALRQARALAERHGVLVLAKGGHLPGPACPDALVSADGVLAEFAGRRIETRSTHGTGCSLSSALATLFARHGDWVVATGLAREWLRGAISAAEALDVGSGNGPLQHAHALWSGEGVPRAATERWWRDAAPVRAAIDAGSFVRGMTDGSLDREVFEHYLAQDALYLRAYSAVLARAAMLAGDEDERAFWAASSATCLEVELELHRSRVGEPAVAPSAETAAYLAHLDAAAAAGDYGVLVAAVLPCFWIYEDVGRRLATAAHPDHPYADWLGTYGDPAFAEATRRAIRIADRAATRADPDALGRMREAFLASCAHERAFFEQRPARHADAGAPRPDGAHAVV